MLMNPHNTLSRALVLWFGLFQLVHTAVVVRYVLTPTPLPFPSPPGGWSSQAVAFMNGMAGADAVNGVLALVFVAGFLRGARWSVWLGMLVLAISTYSTFAFTWGFVQSGAWAVASPAIRWANIVFVPNFVLFGLWIYWSSKGTLASLLPVRTGSRTNA